MGSNNQSDEWSGHPPFNGAEDGVPFEKGESGNPDGAESKHGLYQPVDKFFDEREYARQERDELIDTLKEYAAYPDRDGHLIEQYADLIVMTKYVRRELGAVDENDTHDKLNRRETQARQTHKRIDWESDEKRKDEFAGVEGIYDMMNGDEP